jgi:hypothetical protein
MPDETDATSEIPKPEAAQEPKVRRISNRNPGKSAGTAPEAPSKPEKKAEEDQSPGSAPDSKEDAQTDQKRKNRRRRGKAKPSSKDSDQGSENDAPDGETTDPESAGDAPETPAGKGKFDPPGRPKENQRQQQKPRPKLDPDKVSKNAWKIFLAEVSEEGVALIGDSDARELARRCFRLAEIFLEEEDRRG